MEKYKAGEVLVYKQDGAQLEVKILEVINAERDMYKLKIVSIIKGHPRYPNVRPGNEMITETDPWAPPEKAWSLSKVAKQPNPSRNTFNDDELIAVFVEVKKGSTTQEAIRKLGL